MSFASLAARTLAEEPSHAIRQRQKFPDGANVMQGDVYDGRFYERLAVMAHTSSGWQISSEPLT
jgi:hypothetical protein